MNKTLSSRVQLTFFCLAVYMPMKLQHSFGKGDQTPLSKQEMFEINNEIRIDYSPVKSSEPFELATKALLSKQELLEISDNISLYYAPRILSNSKKLVLLAIDPQHLYAYWSLGDNKDYALSKAISDGEMVLRIYSHVDGIRDPVKLQQLVEIAINKLQSGQKIKLPGHKKSADYSASIGKTNSKKPFIPLLNTKFSDAYHKKSSQKLTKKSELDSANFNNTVYNKKPPSFKFEDEVFKGLGSVKSHYTSSNYSGKGKKK